VLALLAADDDDDAWRRVQDFVAAMEEGVA
jgi:dGTP triphosphohydrolase